MVHCIPLIGRIQIGMALALAALFAAHAARAEEQAQRVVTAGSAITEIVYALGEEDRLVGRDSTSTYPPAVNDVANMGYVRALSPEGVLSMAPDLIIATDQAGPPQAIDVLKQAGVRYVEIEDVATPESVIDKIRIVGDALGVPDKAEALAAKTEAELASAIKAAAPADGSTTPKKVLFLISVQDNRLMAGGEDTAAEAIIRLSGGQNAVAGFSGYKPLSPEAVQKAAPDVILMMDRGGDHAASNEELFSLPQLATSPAAETDSVVRMSGILLLGFGPRTPDAIRQLSQALKAGS